MSEAEFMAAMSAICERYAANVAAQAARVERERYEFVRPHVRVIRGFWRRRRGAR
jgi:hypothetical protein